MHASEADPPRRRILVATQTEALAAVMGLVAELDRDAGEDRTLDVSTCDLLGPTAAAVLRSRLGFEPALRLDVASAPDDLLAYGLGPDPPRRGDAPMLAVVSAPQNITEMYAGILDFWAAAVGAEANRAATVSGELAVNAARHGGPESHATIAAGLGLDGRTPVAVFATVSLGESLPDRVRAYLAQPGYSDDLATLWAAARGKSTWRRDDPLAGRSSSGLGLHVARLQAAVLGARVEILTGSVVLTLGEMVEVRPATVPLQGTLARLVVPLP